MIIKIIHKETDHFLEIEMIQDPEVFQTIDKDQIVEMDPEVDPTVETEVHQEIITTDQTHPTKIVTDQIHTQEEIHFPDKTPTQDQILGIEVKVQTDPLISRDLGKTRYGQPVRPHTM